MGHPKFARPKYDTPPHPWKADRIEEEHAIRANHGDLESKICSSPYPWTSDEIDRSC